MALMAFTIAGCILCLPGLLVAGSLSHPLQPDGGAHNHIPTTASHRAHITCAGLESTIGIYNNSGFFLSDEELARLVVPSGDISVRSLGRQLASKGLPTTGSREELTQRVADIHRVRGTGL